MILTEDEAKTKWCPEAQAAFYIGTTLVFANRDVVHKPNPHPNTLCLGSACMVWRWWRSPEDAATDIIHGEPERPATGYCGKAGEP